MNAEETTAQHAAEIDWQAIHESIQVIFASLADVVQAERPSIRSRGGKTQTASQLLFTYRVFAVASDSELDPLVAGVDFAPASTGRDIRIHADLCGEESGRIYFELPEQTVPIVQDVLCATAQGLARELSEQGDVILAALNQQKTVPSPDLGAQVNGMDIVRKEYESHP
jgi:hypothetical protein